MTSLPPFSALKLLVEWQELAKNLASTLLNGSPFGDFWGTWHNLDWTPENEPNKYLNPDLNFFYSGRLLLNPDLTCCQHL